MHARSHRQIVSKSMRFRPFYPHRKYTFVLELEDLNVFHSLRFSLFLHLYHHPTLLPHLPHTSLTTPSQCLSLVLRLLDENKNSVHIGIISWKKKKQKLPFSAQATSTNRHLQLVDLQNSLVPPRAVSRSHLYPSLFGELVVLHMSMCVPYAVRLCVCVRIMYVCVRASTFMNFVSLFLAR